MDEYISDIMHGGVCLIKMKVLLLGQICGQILADIGRVFFPRECKLQWEETPCRDLFCRWRGFPEAQRSTSQEL